MQFYAILEYILCQLGDNNFYLKFRITKNKVDL